MAIIQISKIQVRSGDLVDLPQLDEGEFGWASDNKKLYIGKTTPNENIEILTSYSQINFSALTGSYGNLNITSPTTGQVLAYDATSNTWINAGGSVTNTVNLGDASSLKILGGAIGYVLETDGTGNLAWTPKGTISANITNATKANPVVITTEVDNFFTDGSHVTITNVNGMTQLNGNSYYANVLTSNTFALYSDSGLTTPIDGTGYGTYTGNGRAVASVGGGAGGGTVGGSTYSVQYNAGGIATGDANFQWNYSTQALSITGTASVSGNANVGNLNTAGQIISTIATGTAPLTVTSTTRVANLDVAKSGVANTVNDAAQPNITSVGTLTSLTSSGNITAPILIATANGTGNTVKIGDDVWLGDINVTNTMVIKGQQDGANGYVVFGNGDTTSTLGRAGTGPLTYNGAFSAVGNANVGNLGTAGLITATGNIGGGNINTGGLITATGNIGGGNINTVGLVTATGNVKSSAFLVGANLSVTGNANIGNIGTAGLITATGNLNAGNVITTGVISSTGNANVGNLGTAGLITATGNLNAGNVITAGVISATGNANVGNLGTAGLITATGNLNAGNIITGGLVTATGNVTSTAFLVGANLSISGNANVGNLGATTVSGTSVSVSGNVTAGNIVLANAAIITGNNLSLTTGANTNAGTITGNWTLTTGSKLQATYADLAEYYESDQYYEPGTVLEFGGEREVTLAQDGTTRVAGVVSTNPAYAMNADCQGVAVAIALQGRVPTKVRGTIRKGDMMVSAGNGFARPWNTPAMGTVIGKALENFDGVEGTIEIVVGRL